MCITPISFARSTGRWKFLGYWILKVISSGRESSLPCRPPCQPLCPSSCRPPGQLPWASPPSFCEVSVWSGRLEGFESITMNKMVSQSITKVGLELLGQLKTENELKCINFNIYVQWFPNIRIILALIFPKLWQYSWSWHRLYDKELTHRGPSISRQSTGEGHCLLF